MSHEPAAVRFSDGLILFGEYNAVSDVCRPKLFDTIEELEAHWRNGEWPECACGPLSEHGPVEIACGTSFHWKGIACRYCKTLVDHLVPSFGCFTDPTRDDGYQDGEPEWSPWKKRREEEAAQQEHAQ